MNERSTLYWSHLKAYEECPQKFLWTKGWNNIDCGGGPGKGKPKPTLRSRHHAMMGIVTQFAIEKMYNDELWREPKLLKHRLLDLVDQEWGRQEEDPRNPINYNEAGSRDSLLKVCRDGVVGYLQTMKQHRLLGTYAKAEVNLVGWIDKWNQIGGRADLIMRREDTGVSIIDGKNTQHKMKYTDVDQLRWYALLFKLAYKEIPDRLGFVWYRFPYDPETEEEGVEWVPFTLEDIQGLAQRALDVKKAMRKEKFDPTPTPPVCRFCDFESVCPERQAQRQANASKRSGPKIEEISGATGFVDLTL